MYVCCSYIEFEKKKISKLITRAVTCEIIRKLILTK
jgi:hypothetical protein